MDKMKRIKIVLGLGAVAVLIFFSLLTEKQDMKPQADPVLTQESSQLDEKEFPKAPSVESMESGTIENEAEVTEKPESVESEQTPEEPSREGILPVIPLEEETPREPAAEHQNEEDEPVTQPAAEEAEEADLVQEEDDAASLSEDAVTEMEDSLSVQDYAKGLSLLAKLPMETVDRFVELRKDGFTAEEQAEIKAILLESYQGEDLEWIVQMYHQVQGE